MLQIQPDQCLSHVATRASTSRAGESCSVLRRSSLGAAHQPALVPANAARLSQKRGGHHPWPRRCSRQQRALPLRIGTHAVSPQAPRDRSPFADPKATLTVDRSKTSRPGLWAHRGLYCALDAAFAKVSSRSQRRQWPSHGVLLPPCIPLTSDPLPAMSKCTRRAAIILGTRTLRMLWRRHWLRVRASLDYRTASRAAHLLRRQRTNAC